jgi:hypothetical protein
LHHRRGDRATTDIRTPFSGAKRVAPPGAAALVIFAIAIGPGLARGADETVERPDRPPAVNPVNAPALLAAQTEEQDEQQRLDGPAPRAERLESRDAYADQDAADALATARSEFGEFVSTPFWQGPRLGDGEHIERYIGASGALVALPNGRQVLMESATPLRTEADDGTLRPVETALVRDDEELAPANAPVDVALSTDPQDGITVGDSGVGIRAEGTDSSATTKVTGDKAFYANVGDGADTDLIAGIAPGGVELAFQLRSEDSPEDPALKFDLPAGASLRLQNDLAASADAAPGGAAVVSDAGTLGTITPPFAVDADGQQVPVTYETRDSNELVVRVDHRGRDVHYPILVDPGYVVENYNGNNGDFYNSNNPSTQKWTYSETDPDFNGSQGGTAPGGTGLRLNMVGGVPVNGVNCCYYPDGSNAEWYWQAPPDSQIVRADFLRVAHDFNSSLVTIGVLGWNSVLGRFEWQGKPNTGITPWYITGAQTDVSKTICTDRDTPCANGDASEQNWAIFNFQSTGGGNPRARSNYTAMNQVKVSLWENHAPTIAASDVTGQRPVGWVQSGVDSFRATAKDLGLGLDTMEFRKPTGNVTKATPCHAGTGDRFGQCPKSYTFPPTTEAPFSYDIGNLPDGDNVLGLLATDFIGNPSGGIWPNATIDAYKWHVKVDTKPPVVPANGLSGPLYDDRNVTDDEGSVDAGSISSDENVTIDAYDGTASLPASGIATVEMLVDGVLRRPEDRHTASCTVAGGCPFGGPNKTFTLQPSTFSGGGDHKITLVVRDQLADPTRITDGTHVTTRSFDVYVDPGEPPEDPDATTTDMGGPNDPPAPIDNTGVPTISAAQEALVTDAIHTDAITLGTPLLNVLGGPSYSVDELGPLTRGDPTTGDPVTVGGAAILTLPMPRAVDATVPALAPGSTASAMTKYNAHFQGTVSDVLVLVDLTATPKIVSIQPGPNSSAIYEPPPGLTLPESPEDSD